MNTSFVAVSLLMWGLQIKACFLFFLFFFIFVTGRILTDIARHVRGRGDIWRCVLSIHREYIGRLGMCHGWYVEGLSRLGEWERVEVYESCVMEMGDMDGCYVRLLGEGEELLFRLGMGGEE